MRKVLKNWISSAVSNEGYRCGDLNIIFCSDTYLLKINQQYLEHDYYTDVITFDYSEEGIISGDIFISVDRVRENSYIYKVSFNEELNRVIIHGVLHLLGYGDKDAHLKKIMTEKENFYLFQGGFLAEVRD